LDQSLHWKQVGNDHFNKQEYEEAKKCYIQAIQLDKSNEVLFANLSHTYLKLENFGEAEKAIESCLRIRPSWAKAWYRKGVIAMSQNKYLEASTSFQKALAIEPNNQEISNQLLRAINAESTSSTTNKSNGTKMDKQFIGTMLQMRAVSWVLCALHFRNAHLLIYEQDFKSWYATNRHCLNYWMPDSWDDSYNDIVASPTYQSRIAEVMRNLLPNFQIGQYPGSTVAKNISHLKQTIAKLIYPNEPVLNALYVATLMRTRFQKDNWSVVWTLSASTSSEQNTSARAIVVSRSQKMVVNFPGLVGTRGLDLEALKDHLATQLALFMNAEVNDVENEDYNEEYDAEAPISNDLHSSTADDHLKPKQRRVGIRRKENHNQEFAVSEMIIYACEDLTLVDTFSRQLYAAKTDFLKPIDKEKSKSDSKQDNGLEKILFQKQQSSKRQNDKEKNTVNSVEASGTKVQEFGSIADAQNMIDSQVNGTGSATSNFLTNIWRSNNSQTISDSHLRYWTRQAATICAVLALCIGVIYV